MLSILTTIWTQKNTSNWKKVEWIKSVAKKLQKINLNILKHVMYIFFIYDQTSFWILAMVIFKCWNVWAYMGIYHPKVEQFFAISNLCNDCLSDKTNQNVKEFSFPFSVELHCYLNCSKHSNESHSCAEWHFASFGWTRLCHLHHPPAINTRHRKCAWK